MAKLGLDCVLHRNSGTYASPTWVAVDNVQDVVLTLTKGEAEATTRANGGWRATLGALKEGAVEFSMLWDTADADFTAIQEAFLENTPIEFAVMDGPIATAGSQGLRATFEVFSFTRNENLEEAVTVDVSIKPTVAANAPSWMTIAS